MDGLRRKIYEYNPYTGVLRWRYVGEGLAGYGWPLYGRTDADVALVP